MKLNKLLITNIHSLADSHTIDFEDIERSSEGVFLITGPTGAGKTTILDAITLALYGMVSRVNEKITESNVQKHGSILTHGRSNAKAEVIFSIDGDTYTATWEINKKPRASGLVVNHQLTGTDGSVIASGPREVPKKVQDLLGMDYTQFTKSILLAQGDFAAFLKAKFDDKASILEKISGTEIYAVISRQVYDHWKRLNQQFQDLQIKIAQLEILSPEQLEELQQRQVDLMKQNQILNQGISDHQSKIHLIDQRQNALTRRTAIQNDITNIDHSITHFIANYQTAINQLDNVLTIRSNYLDYRSLTTKREQTAQKIGHFETSLTNIRSKNDTLISDIARYVETTGTTEEAIAALKIFAQKVSGLDMEIKTLETACSHDRRLLKEIKGFTLTAEEPDVQIVRLEKQSTEIEVSMSDLTKVLGSIEPTPEMISALDAQLRTWLVINEKIGQFRKSRQALLSEKETETTVSKAIAEFQTLQETNRKALASAKAILEDKKRIKTLHEKVQSLEAQRLALSPDEDCPLCGAHPSAGPLRTGSHQHSDTEVQQAYLAAEQQVEMVQSELNRVQTDLVIAQTKLTQAHAGIQRYETELEEIKTTMVRLKEEVQFSGSLSDNQNIVQEEMQHLQSRKSTIEAYMHLQTQKEAVETAIPRLKAYRDNTALLQSVTAARNALYNRSEPVTLFTDDVISKFQAYRLEATQIEGNISALTQQLKEIDTECMAQQQVIDRFISEHQLGNIEAIGAILAQEEALKKKKEELIGLKDLLKEKRVAMDIIEQQINDLPIIETPKEALVEAVSAYQNELSAVSEAIGRIKVQLETNTRNQEKAIGLAQEKERLQGDLNIAEKLNNLIGSANGSRFKRIAQKITLSQLAIHANKHLEQMSGRYRFEYDPEALWNEAVDMELMIRDAFQLDSLRWTLTLSGGETFIASLALALGLSDYASNNNRIESLFVDEGFGTLDAETLDMALSALESIQAKGNKTLCLITHVEAMKERIPYHLKVTKKEGGFSRIHYEINS